MNKYKILYAEDDETIAFLMQEHLSVQYEITHCKNGQEALSSFIQNEYDICLLDIMMPELNGFELAKEIRMRNVEIPIIFISAKTLKEDRIKGLKIGADDYLVKPFSIEELKLKIEIFLKRTKKKIDKPIHYQIGDYKLDAKNYKLIKNNELVSLTQREAELLTFFAQNINSVLKREEILIAVWGNDDYFLGRSLDVFISRLRKLLSEDDSITIENVHGVGFQLCIG